jgi:hypothetical protein
MRHSRGYLVWLLYVQMQGPNPPRMVVMVNPCNPVSKAGSPLKEKE